MKQKSRKPDKSSVVPNCQNTSTQKSKVTNNTLLASSLLQNHYNIGTRVSGTKPLKTFVQRSPDPNPYNAGTQFSGTKVLKYFSRKSPVPNL